VLEIVLTRIDNRLIHGQVVTSWVQEKKVEHIMVVNDTVAKNPMEKSVLKMAKPRQVKSVDVLTVAEAAKKLKADTSKGRLMIVTRVPQDVKGLIEAGVEFTEIWVGNMHGAPGKKQLDQCVFADEEEIEALKFIASKGVTIISQMTTSSPRTELNGKL
jgi:mannose/fructose/N-acetylgalactosamine-specific phosphotransferase system component IIB